MLEDGTLPSTSGGLSSRSLFEGTVSSNSLCAAYKAFLAQETTPHGADRNCLLNRENCLPAAKVKPQLN